MVNYKNGSKKYILNPSGLKVGSKIISSNEADIKIGNSLQLANIPVGTQIHNIEITMGKGAQLVRAAGTYAVITAKNENYVTIKLPSGEVNAFIIYDSGVYLWYGIIDSFLGIILILLMIGA